MSDSAWLLCFARAFGNSCREACLHVARSGETLRAVLPMCPGGTVFRVWSSVENEHNPYWTFALDIGEKTAAQALLQHLLKSSEYAFFKRLHQDGPVCNALLEAASALRLRSSLIQSELGDALIPLFGPWEVFKKSLSKNLRRDIPRKMRGLERLGRVELSVTTGVGEIGAALEECYELETRGWKSVSGSPILSDARTYRFYSELARDLAVSSRFALYRLRLNHRTIAYEYCLRADGWLDMLKLSFDPRFSAYSPGGVLRMLLLEREVNEGQVRSYHLGRPSEWKMRWATAVWPLATLRVFGKTPRARAAYLVSVELRHRLKKLKKLRRVQVRNSSTFGPPGLSLGVLPKHVVHQGFGRRWGLRREKE